MVLLPLILRGSGHRLASRPVQPRAAVRPISPVRQSARWSQRPTSPRNSAGDASTRTRNQRTGTRVAPECPQRTPFRQLRRPHAEKQRRGRDSNPRRTLRPATVFETCAMVSEDQHAIPRACCVVAAAFTRKQQ
jgi:hypothetical protein